MIMFLLTVPYESDVNRPVDDTLILRIAQGDREALREVYDRAAKRIYGFALSVTKNQHDAEDVLQETILKVYANATAYVPKGKPMAWILTIARNAALSKQREQSKSCAYEECESFLTDTFTFKNTDDRLLIETLFRILKDDEKQILTLHAVSGLKHREIADVMHLPLSTVLSKYHRAAKKLQQALEVSE